MYDNFCSLTIRVTGRDSQTGQIETRVRYPWWQSEGWRGGREGEEHVVVRFAGAGVGDFFHKALLEGGMDST